MKIAIKTLGCKVNTYDSEAVWELFKVNGYQKVAPTEIADVYVINTCTVTNNGDKKSRQTIRKMIRLNPEAIICVIGCYAQLKPDEVSQIEGVDIVLGTQGREQLYDLVQKFIKQRRPIVSVSNIMEQKDFEALDVINFESQTRAFIKIQEGCNNFCTFCIIPWARGLLRSKDPKELIAQIKHLGDEGVKEIVLTGIHTGGYGVDLDNFSFANLLREIDKIDTIKRVRISSIEISQIDDEVIEYLKTSTKIVDHLHVPIQAASDEILIKMKRHYLVEQYIKKIEQLREIFPDIAITTDIIVGFPGETDELFEESLLNVQKINFSELHVFPYSIRVGTPAARMENQVSDLTKKNRVNQMITLNNKLAFNYAKSFEGDILSVLVERRQKNGKLAGHSTNYLKVEFDGDDDVINTIVNVQIIESGYPINIGKII